MKDLNNMSVESLDEFTVTGCQMEKISSDSEYTLYNEEYFKKLLSTERKRTERSRKPFLLLLINIEKTLSALKSNEVFCDLLSVLICNTRETDIHGWYRRNAEIGIICTEIDHEESRKVAEAIAHKIRTSLLMHLPVSLVQTMDLRAHLFPEAPGKQITIDLVDQTFYPEIGEREIRAKVKFFLKRFLDITGSLIALLIFSPVFLVIPALIKITSRGPVFFRQERIGWRGARFVFLKFRSMYTNNNDAIHREYVRDLIAGKIEGCEEGNAVYKIQDDPRVTPVGRFLRKTSLDEFPQFVNVLRGEMSLVGPRPAIPYEFENYDIWHRHRLLQVKPGITGLWQVKGRSSTTFDEMVRLDLKYIREWSLWLDIKLLFLTPFAVLKGKGAC